MSYYPNYGYTRDTRAGGFYDSFYLSGLVLLPPGVFAIYSPFNLKPEMTAV
jgi:hypothetical protein